MVTVYYCLSLHQSRPACRYCFMTGEESPGNKGHRTFEKKVAVRLQIQGRK